MIYADCPFSALHFKTSAAIFGLPKAECPEALPPENLPYHLGLGCDLQLLLRPDSFVIGRYQSPHLGGVFSLFLNPSGLAKQRGGCTTCANSMLCPIPRRGASGTVGSLAT